MPQWLGSLGPKVLAVLFAVAAINTALSAYVLERVMRPAFQGIERQQAQDDLARVRSALGNEFAHLSATAADWAVWDDSHAFVLGGKDDYLAANIQPMVFQNLNLAAIAFFDLNGGEVFLRTADPATGLEAPLPGADARRLLAALATPPPGGIYEARAGLLAAGSSLLIAVSHPVLDSLAEQPPAGTLVMARPLNAAMHAELQRHTGVVFRLLPLSQADPSGLPAAIRPWLAEPEIGPVKMEVLQGDRLGAYTVLPDIAGRPALLLEAVLDRDVTVAGREAMDLAILLMVAAALADLVVVWLLLDRMILRPVRRLTRHIQSARQDGPPEPPPSLGWRRGDEIGVMADAYDRLNAALARQVGDLNHALEGLHAADAAKSNFFANMSHELRTPLNAIIGFSELLESEAFGPLPSDRYRIYVQDIHASGNHLLDLVNHVLEYAKADSQQLQIAKQPVDLRAIVEEAIRMIRLQAERAGVELHCAVGDDLPLLPSDRLRLSQILLNLLSNAVKFTDPGGSVTVSAALQQGRIDVQVADTGIGMTAEEIPRAMAPFVQLRNRNRQALGDDQGTGLGLPLARRLTELLGGRFDLVSAPGRGTTVSLAFPCPARDGGAA